MPKTLLVAAMLAVPAAHAADGPGSRIRATPPQSVPPGTGGASGVGTGATSGTSGGATFGGSAPR
jgi:hypothetical protein